MSRIHDMANRQRPSTLDDAKAPSGGRPICFLGILSFGGGILTVAAGLLNFTPNKCPVGLLTLSHRSQLLLNALCYCGPSILLIAAGAWSIIRKNPHTVDSKLVAAAGVGLNLILLLVYSKILYGLHVGYL